MVIVFLIVSLVLFFTLVVGVFVSALAVAFLNIAREDRHRPGADFRKGIRDKIRRAIVTTDVHSQRLEDFNEFIEAMINEIGITDGMTGNIPKVDVAVIDTLISEYRHVANYAGIHSAAQVMRLFDLEGKGYLTISQLRNFKRFLIQARVTVPELPSADTDRPIRTSTTRPPQIRADEMMGAASGDTVGSTVRAITRDFPSHNVSGGAMGSSGIGFQVTAKSPGGNGGDDACFADMSIVDAVPRLQKDLYDVKKQLASMTLTLRNVAALDTKIDNFDASLTRMVKYMLSSPQVATGSVESAVHTLSSKLDLLMLSFMAKANKDQRGKQMEEESLASQAEQSSALLDAVHSDALLFD